MMDPILGSALVAAIQAIAAIARQSGMTLEEADKYFQGGYAQVKENIPGKLPNA